MRPFEPASRPDDLQRLLENSSWVRRLASQLLWDESLTDDVLQEVWISALKRPPSKAGALRVWLRTVVRSLCLRANRALLRRRRLESQGEKRFEVPAADDVEAKLESQQRLLQAVFALHEPYRSVVYLHFYESLKLVEIARLKSTSDSTVRTQLARGLEQLRDRLSRECGGQDALRAMLLALVFPTALLSLGTLAASEPPEPREPKAPAPPRYLAPPRGSRIIPWAGAASLLITALVAWLVLPWRSEALVSQPPGGLHSQAEDKEIITALNLEPPVPETIVPKPKQAELASVATAVTVQVINAASGEAIQAAQIYCAPRTAPRSELLGETDAAGILPVDDPVALRDPWIVVAAGFIEHREPAARRDTEGPEYVIALEPEHLAHIAVFDVDGSPAAGVEIKVSARIRGVRSVEPLTLSTDQRGEARYTFRHLDTTLRVEAPDRVSLSLPAVTPHMEIHLRPGRRVDGVVVGPDGQPVAACRVRIESSSRKNPLTVVSDATGSFPLGCLDPQEDVALRFNAVGLPAYRLRGQPPATGPWRCQIPAGAALAGLVLAPNGEPVSSGQVLLLTPESSDTATTEGPACALRTAGMPPAPRATRRLQSLARTAIDAQGRFELGPIALGAAGASERYLFVHHPGFARQLQRLEAGEPETAVTIHLEEGVKITGVAVAPDGAPVAGALLHFGEIWSNGLEGVIGRARTAASGRFEFSGLPAGVGQPLGSAGNEDAWSADQSEVLRSSVFVSAFAPDVLLAKRPTGNAPAGEISPGAFDIALELENGKELSLVVAAKNRLAAINIRLRDANGLPVRAWTRAVVLDPEGNAHSGVLGDNLHGARFFSDQTLSVERWRTAELFLFPEGHSWLAIPDLDFTGSGSLDVELARQLAHPWRLRLRLRQADGGEAGPWQVLIGLPFGAERPQATALLGTLDGHGELAITCLPPGRHTIGLTRTQDEDETGIVWSSVVVAAGAEWEIGVSSP